MFDSTIMSAASYVNDAIGVCVMRPAASYCAPAMVLRFVVASTPNAVAVPPVVREI